MTGYLIHAAAVTAAAFALFGLNLKKAGQKPAVALLGLALCTALGLAAAKILYVALLQLDYILEWGEWDVLLDWEPKRLCFVGGGVGVWLGIRLAARIMRENPRTVLDAFAAPGALLTAGLRLAEIHLGKLGAGSLVDWTGILAGAPFTVTDSGGSVLFSGQTDQNGRLNAPDLEVGKTVTVTETVPENYVCENRVQTVTLAAGSNTVTFRNIPLGTATMNKVSDGGNVDGYCFRLYRFEGNGNSSRTWCGKSDTDGRIYETDRDFILLGGEKSFVFTGLTDGKYSFRELLSLHGAGNVWPESITFTTGGGTTLACNLSFAGEQLVAQANGDCTVSGIELTGLDGGGTLTITIKNEPVPMASITVRKVDESGKAMKGVSFLLEYSTDGGSAWAPVTSRGETEPMTPGGCTSVGLKNGVLVAGNDGLAAFTGLCVETDSGPVLYRLTETATRPGYSLLAGPAFEGPLPEGETHDVTLTAVNMPEFQMPMTGARGFGFTTVGVFVSLLSATALLILLRKKRRNEAI